jgi:multicomponent Na+:H+ antiporter subunit G
MTAVGMVLVSAGVLILLVSAVGLVRLPDVYTRSHAVAKSETLGLILFFGGLLFFPQVTLAVALRLALILAFAVLANPTAVHALARAARRARTPVWTREPT